MAAGHEGTGSNNPSAKLHILLRDGGVIEREIEKDETRIGKGPNNDIMLPDASVSGTHAMIRFAGDHFVLTDLGSRNGTFINDARLSQPRPLKHGDLVRMGHCTITFRLTDAEETASHPRTLLLQDQPPPPPIPPPAPKSRPATEDSLAEALISGGLVPQTVLDKLRGPGAGLRRLCRALIEDKLMTEAALRDLMSRTFNIKPVDIKTMEVNAGQARALNPRFLRERLVCPVVGQAEDNILLAVFDPTDLDTIKDVELKTGKALTLRLALPSEIAHKLDEHFTPRLIGVLPTGQKIESILNNQETEIGKASHNRLVVTDATVSNTHAIVLARDGGYSIVDLGSSNGTFINGRPLGKESHTLQHGDKIQLGQVLLTFRNPAETTENKTAKLSIEALEEVRSRAMSRSTPGNGRDTASQVIPAAVSDDSDKEEKKKKKKKDSDKKGWLNPNALSRIVAQVAGALIGLAGIYWISTLTQQPATPTSQGPISTGDVVLAENLVRLGDWEAFGTGLFGGRLETSGVSNYPGGNNVLLVDDNRTSEILLMNLDQDGNQLGSIQTIPLGVSFKDPEAITYGNSYFYMVTSQSEPKDPANNVIVRFGIDPATKSLRGQAEMISNLRSFLLSNVSVISASGSPEGKKGGLNIEGIAWDPNNERLLLGLRSPLIGDQAVLVPIKLRDPRGAFNIQNLVVDDPQVIILSLEGHGIRDITYDPRLKDFLILSGAPETMDRTDFGLWVWTGRSDSKPLKLMTLEDDMKPEGLTNISINSRDYVLIVGDSGRYIKLDYQKRN